MHMKTHSLIRVTYYKHLPINIPNYSWMPNLENQEYYFYTHDLPFPMALVMREGRSSWGKSFPKSSSRSDPPSELECCACGEDVGLPDRPELLSSPSSSPDPAVTPPSPTPSTLPLGSFLSWEAGWSLGGTSKDEYGLMGVMSI